MRLSRDDENYGDSVSIETQRTILRQYANDHNLYVIDEYVDAPDIIGLKQNPTKRASL